MTHAIAARCATAILALAVTAAAFAQDPPVLGASGQGQAGSRASPRCLPVHRIACSKAIPPKGRRHASAAVSGQLRHPASLAQHGRNASRC
jgi:hypothetical protein